jgi:hypothetical protein
VPANTDTVGIALFCAATTAALIAVNDADGPTVSTDTEPDGEVEDWPDEELVTALVGVAVESGTLVEVGFVVGALGVELTGLVEAE